MFMQNGNVMLTKTKSNKTHTKYFQTRNIKIQVRIIPPNRITLSCPDLLSIRRRTVFDRPSTFIMSNTLRWTPLSIPRWSRRLDKMLDPVEIISSMLRPAELRRWPCCSAASIMMDVSGSFGAKSLDKSMSRSRASSSFWNLRTWIQRCFVLEISG